MKNLIIAALCVAFLGCRKQEEAAPPAPAPQAPACVSTLPALRDALGITEAECPCPTTETWCGLRRSLLAFLATGDTVHLQDEPILIFNQDTAFAEGGAGLQLTECAPSPGGSFGALYLRWLVPAGSGAQTNAAIPVYDGCGDYGHPFLLERAGVEYSLKAGPGPLTWKNNGQQVAVEKIVILE